MSGSESRHTVLEPAVENLVDDLKGPPFIYQVSPAEGRQMMSDVQKTEVQKYPAKIDEETLSCGPIFGDVSVRYVTPPTIDTSKRSDLILFLHGGGWIYGDEHTHDKLVREIAYRCRSVVAFPLYALSPEKRFPTAVEQCYRVLLHLETVSEMRGWRFDRVTLAGDSAGGNLATVLPLMCAARNGPVVHKQVLYCPVTDCSMDTASYREFNANYLLTRDGMKRSWEAYIPNPEERKNIYASPLRASLDQLCQQPPCLIVTAEADPLRDEGEAYARRLRLAGTKVANIRLGATIHDVVVINQLDHTEACRLAMDASTNWINSYNTDH